MEFDDNGGRFVPRPLILETRMSKFKKTLWKIGIGLVLAVAVFLLAGTFLRGCTQTMARQYGMWETIKLEPGQELMMMTWQDKDHLWLLIKDKKTGNCEFKEHSKYGWMEGSIYVKEQKEQPKK